MADDIEKKDYIEETDSAEETNQIEDVDSAEQKDTNAILKKVTATTLTLRVAIGGFLVYLAYSIGIGLGDTTGKDTIILGAFTVLFAFIGVVIVLMNAYRLVRKDYYDPTKEE